MVLDPVGHISTKVGSEVLAKSREYPRKSSKADAHSLKNSFCAKRSCAKGPADDSAGPRLSERFLLSTVLS